MKLHLRGCYAFKTLLTAGILFLISCHKDPVVQTTNTTTDSTSKKSYGWTGNDDPSKVPQAINAAQLFGASALPPSVDLTPYLPPIGNQGQTGTCVAWATAYYTKSASEAVAYNYTTSQLVSPAYQLSPKYLFLSIPDNQKGSNCQGTDFAPALEALLSNGVATLQTVPFNDLGSCSSSQILQSWNEDAAHHKIKYYRSVEVSAQGIKEQLANKNPVIIGVKVTNELASGNGRNVVDQVTGYLSPAEYHALAVVGYDDNKGKEGAFRIANSWTSGWGDNGFIWVGYSTLLNNWIFNNNAYYIVTDDSNNPPAPSPTPPTPPGPGNNSVDLAAWVFSDISTSLQTGFPNSRTISLNLYNVGTNTVNPGNWDFYYMYYNAYNANDYGIIFHDGFNSTAAANTFSCPNGASCNFNYSIAPGSSFAQTVFGQQFVNRGYFVPPLTGYYYLILIVDPNRVLNDANRQNNIFYTTGQVPKLFQNGLSNRKDPSSGRLDSFINELSPTTFALKGSVYNSAVSSVNKNAYTPGEIISFVKRKYESGEIRQRINALPQSQTLKVNRVYNF